MSRTKWQCDKKLMERLPQIEQIMKPISLIFLLFSFASASIMTGCAESSGGGSSADNQGATDDTSSNETIYAVTGPYAVIGFMSDSSSDNRSWFEEVAMEDSNSNDIYSTSLIKTSWAETHPSSVNNAYSTDTDGTLDYEYGGGIADMQGMRTPNNALFSAGTTQNGDERQSIQLGIFFDESLSTADLEGDFHVFYISGDSESNGLTTGRYHWTFDGEGTISINNTNDGDRWSGDQTDPLPTVSEYSYSMPENDDGRLTISTSGPVYEGNVSPDGSAFYARHESDGNFFYHSNSILYGVKVPSDTELSEGQALLEGIWLQNEICTTATDVSEDARILEYSDDTTALTVSGDTAGTAEKGLIDENKTRTGAIAPGANLWIRISDSENNGQRCFDIAVKSH